MCGHTEGRTAERHLNIFFQFSFLGAKYIRTVWCGHTAAGCFFCVCFFFFFSFLLFECSRSRGRHFSIFSFFFFFSSFFFHFSKV
ncbi:hypothetical protein TCDM_11027 [Trypanosoma cruzi Dm28c]|uniref:Uncharacterized protein n=1 Tax=Trypanosoma cruzi Dm28c TaxID=1416333 RepID=V5D1N3_TRYCR|nr:hypothetical protein TCDM_11027 [Trypanosoma cruzi Dm28c]